MMLAMLRFVCLYRKGFSELTLSWIGGSIGEEYRGEGPASFYQGIDFLSVVCERRDGLTR